MYYKISINNKFSLYLNVILFNDSHDKKLFLYSFIAKINFNFIHNIIVENKYK